MRISPASPSVSQTAANRVGRKRPAATPVTTPVRIAATRNPQLRVFSSGRHTETDEEAERYVRVLREQLVHDLGSRDDGDRRQRNRDRMRVPVEQPPERRDESAEQEQELRADDGAVELPHRLEAQRVEGR